MNMNECYPMPDPADPNYTHGRNWMLDSNRPRLLPDDLLQQPTDNNGVETGITVRQPL